MAKKKQHRRMASMTKDMKTRYTNLFLNALDMMEGAKWQRPWVTTAMGDPCNLYRKGKPYTRSNAFFLEMLCAIEGYETPYFVTKGQRKDESLKYGGLELNVTVKTTETGEPLFDDSGLPVMQYPQAFPVQFWKPVYKDKDGHRISEEDYHAMDDEERKDVMVYWIQQHYWVYNLDQTDFATRYADDYQRMKATETHVYQHGTKDDVLERMIAGEWRCPIKTGGTQACYMPRKDVVMLPKREHFKGDELYYATAVHEMAHSTAKELGRSQTGEFGSEEYAREEFVAELSSAIICSMLGVGKLLDPQHVAYVASWREALRDDSNFVEIAIEQSQKVVRFFADRYNAIAERGETLALPLAA